MILCYLSKFATVSLPMHAKCIVTAQCTFVIWRYYLT